MANPEDRANYTDPPVTARSGSRVANVRDTNNEQVTALAPGAVFTGTFTKIDAYPSFQILYAAIASQPYVATIEWSFDGISQLPAPFGSSVISQRLINGYSVAYSPQNGNQIGSYYRLKIVNGAVPQGPFPYFISINWLINHEYNGAFVFLDDTLGNLSKALLTRSVIAGLKPDDTFTSVGLTPQGDLRVGQQGVIDTFNSTTGVELPVYLGTPFTPIPGAALPVVAADMYIGTGWMPCINFASFGIDAFATALGQGYAIWSTDGGATVSRFQETPFAGPGAFGDPPQGATHMRLAFQNRSATPNTFKSSMVWRYQPQGLFMQPSGAPVDPSFPAVVTTTRALPLPAGAATDMKLDDILTKLNAGLSVVSTPVTWQKLYGAGTGLAVQVKVGPGVLRGVVLKGGATFTAYDSIAGTTGKFIDIAGTQEFTGPFDVTFTLGLRIIVQSSKLFTVIYS